jgi:hypothetical protein
VAAVWAGKLRLLYLINVEWTTREPNEIQQLVRIQFSVFRDVFSDPTRI